MPISIPQMDGPFEAQWAAWMLQDAARSSLTGDRVARRWVDRCAVGYLAVLAPVDVDLDDLVDRYRQFARQDSWFDGQLEIALIGDLHDAQDRDEAGEHFGSLQSMRHPTPSRPDRTDNRNLAQPALPGLQFIEAGAG